MVMTKVVVFLLWLLILLLVLITVVCYSDGHDHVQNSPFWPWLSLLVKILSPFNVFCLKALYFFFKSVTFLFTPKLWFLPFLLSLWLNYCNVFLGGLPLLLSLLKYSVFFSAKPVPQSLTYDIKSKVPPFVGAVSNYSGGISRARSWRTLRYNVMSLHFILTQWDTFKRFSVGACFGKSVSLQFGEGFEDRRHWDYLGH